MFSVLKEKTIKRHRSLSMTYVETNELAKELFGVGIADATKLLSARVPSELYGHVSTPTLAASLFSAILAAPHYPPTLTDTREFGLDISVYNGTFDFEKAAAYEDGYIRYIWQRGGQSWGYEDPTFLPNYQAIYDLTTIIPLIYWVIFPSQPVQEQVDKCLRTLAKLEGAWRLSSDADCPTLWIDLELNHNKSAAVINAKTWEFLDKCQQALGRPVGIYSGDWFLRRYCQPWPAWYAKVYWWLAQYLNVEVGMEHPGPVAKPSAIPWEQVAFHQTSSYVNALPMGAVGDGNSRVDTNRFLLEQYGNPFDEFTGIAIDPPPVPPIPGDGCGAQIAELKKELARLSDTAISLDDRVSKNRAES